jgi:two-component system nitrogen regulation sensor histidine kinase GlnL
MAAGIAHEIRNPLGGIRGAAQLLQRTPGEAELTELTELIIQESDRINSLVEQLMQFTRPRRLERSDVDINRLVQDEVALLRAQFSSEDVEWDLDLDPSLPKVEGDRLRLREAVGNLLRNARQAAESKIAVRTHIETGERLTEDGFDRGQSLHLEVRDDGPGIPHSETASIFAPFSTNKPQGTGLGLFVTRQIVDDHGARLTLDPGHGEGALFRLTLTERLMPGPEALEGIPRAFQLPRTPSSPSLAVESSR